MGDASYRSMPQSGAPPHQIGYKVDSVVHAIASGRNRSTAFFQCSQSPFFEERHAHDS